MIERYLCKAASPVTFLGPSRCYSISSMSHPLHGARPMDMSAGFPDAAAVIAARWSDVADRGIVAAVEHNPELRDRVGDLGLRRLLRWCTSR